MSPLAKITVLGAAFMLPAAHALPAMPMDKAITVHAVKAVCTGIGANAERDARYSTYPLRIELAGRLGQYLADAEFSISARHRTLVDLHCAGPWLFVKLAPGRYRVTAKRNGKTATSLAWASAKGQAKDQGRVVLRFPEQGGTVSAEYLKALRQQASTALAEKPHARPAVTAAKHHPALAAKASKHHHMAVVKTQKHRHAAAAMTKKQHQAAKTHHRNVAAKHAARVARSR